MAGPGWDTHRLSLGCLMRRVTALTGLTGVGAQEGGAEVGECVLAVSARSAHLQSWSRAAASHTELPLSRQWLPHSPHRPGPASRGRGRLARQAGPRSVYTSQPAPAATARIKSIPADRDSGLARTTPAWPGLLPDTGHSTLLTWHTVVLSLESWVHHDRTRPYQLTLLCTLSIRNIYSIFYLTTYLKYETI